MRLILFKKKKNVIKYYIYLFNNSNRQKNPIQK